MGWDGTPKYNVKTKLEEEKTMIGETNCMIFAKQICCFNQIFNCFGCGCLNLNCEVDSVTSGAMKVHDGGICQGRVLKGDPTTVYKRN